MSSIAKPPSCSICFMEYKDTPKKKVVRTVECKHYFHKSCMIKWLKTSPTCPICRRVLEGAKRQFHKNRIHNNSATWIRTSPINEQFRPGSFEWRLNLIDPHGFLRASIQNNTQRQSELECPLNTERVLEMLRTLISVLYLGTIVLGITGLMILEIKYRIKKRKI